MIPLPAYSLLLLLGSGALAFWTDYRFPKLRPGLSWKLLLHFAACLLLSRLDAPADSRNLIILWFTLIVAYNVLVSIWVLRALFDKLDDYRGGGHKARANG